ncbi:hypothetical protein FFLO_03357 [Filobasidium floriforme]|uniref:L-lactate dehydrogenase (cytochrome) n=1 Tax=Filobasidium floriforme TaxID=5210 RepID=A0A8K0JMA9_9TREE|nr:putative cytochrome b2, mitochondrial precursor (L-lactate ferricytochrome C oxidoreductase) [Filobasidium floriforme]KAG7544244.1 hypothetical protein FFLO_03357 [Filobasidium floriforme]KAH8085731.1 putative cytochrome b2, mitochondrial precursor (L-lactate ferricytochrome C oxidoreductase) [Filobasidium floriforme]
MAMTQRTTLSALRQSIRSTSGPNQRSCISANVRNHLQQGTSRRGFHASFSTSQRNLAEATKNSRSRWTKVVLGTSAVLSEQPSGQKLISADEVEKHCTSEDCWVIVGGEVYDVTDFLDKHPGGAGVILNKAGQDATQIFTSLHPPGTLSLLPPTAYLGPVDPTTIKQSGPAELDEDEIRVKKAREEMPPIDSILLLQDMEDLAEKVMSKTGWGYYRSASDTEDSYHNNEESWKRYYFRPRVLRDAREKDPSSTMLGHHVSLPIYIAPAAMAKLGHPLGEVNLTRGAGECGIVQGISSNASCSLEEMVEARKDGQSLIFQIYLNKDREASEKLLKKVTDLGCTGIMFTVDAAAASKRTLDQRTKASVNPPPSAPKNNKEAGGEKPKKAVGVAQAISTYQDDNLVWDDIKFIRKHTKLPILVKGIQCLEDAEIAAEYGVEGIILSNHGARQLNFAPASIDVLYEIRQRRPELFDKMEIYVDGGVKSGTDVVKALALGAKGVGLGRSFLYANACYGEEGVQKIYEILHWEVCAAMAMLGAHKISDLKPEMVERAWWLAGQQGSK